MALLIACLVALVAAVAVVGAARDLLYGALALAVASVALSVVLFHFGANVAAAFELSVCAGLITVLFVSTVSLTRDSDRATEARLPALLILPVLAGLGALAYFAATWLLPAGPAAAAPGAGDFREVFWGARATDLLGQIALILTGVIGILAVLRARPAGEAHHD